MLILTKTAYREIQPPVALTDAWQQEEKDALFLYAHIPFCEMRCGFCNLFTTTHPGSGMVNRYLDAMERQCATVSQALGSDAKFSRAALGGGTPTFLEPVELDRLFNTLHRHFQITSGSPTAVELSPATTTPERLAVLKQHHVTRTSIGVQSFIESEVKSLGRHQRPSEVRTALGLLREAKFQILNVDLIYGMQDQTLETWRTSLEAAVQFSPEEIYLYPLYVRPLTGLGRRGAEASDTRPALYRHGRDFLLEAGYRQISMRLFRRGDHPLLEGPAYCCQEDGMVGLGPGARSYTRALHYSSEWAVGQPGVKAIIEDFIGRTNSEFAAADYGAPLDLQEQRRRYLIKSLLRAEGLDSTAYQRQFGTSVLEDFPCLQELTTLEAAEWQGAWLRLTPQGLEWSDLIGPWLFSPETHQRMEEFDLT